MKYEYQELRDVVFLFLNISFIFVNKKPTAYEIHKFNEWTHEIFTLSEFALTFIKVYTC